MDPANHAAYRPDPPSLAGLRSLGTMKSAADSLAPWVATIPESRRAGND